MHGEGVTQSTAAEPQMQKQDPHPRRGPRVALTGDAHWETPLLPQQGVIPASTLAFAFFSLKDFIYLSDLYTQAGLEPTTPRSRVAGSTVRHPSYLPF